MRKISVILFVSIVFVSSATYSQWVPARNGLYEYLGFYEGTNTIVKSGRYIYTANNTRLYQTTNAGDNWTELTSKFAGSPRFTVLFSNGSRMFVAHDSGSSPVRAKLFYSDDSGSTWTQALSVGNASFGSIAASGSKMYALGGSLHYSTDNGATWTTLPFLLSSLTGGTSKFVAMLGDTVFLCNDHYVYRSIDGGASFHNVSGGTSIGSRYMVTLDGVLYVGTTQDVRRSSNGGTTWDTLKSGLSSNIPNQAFYVNGLTLIVGRGQYGGSAYRSTDNGLNWSAFNDGYPASGAITGLVATETYLLASGASGVHRRPLNEIVTGVENKSSHPEKFELLQNYPNPFNPTTEIRFQLSEVSNVSLMVYDGIGREIAALVDENLNAGSYAVKFDATKFSSGVYYYTLRSGYFIDTKQMLLLK